MSILSGPPKPLSVSEALKAPVVRPVKGGEYRVVMSEGEAVVGPTLVPTVGPTVALTPSQLLLGGDCLFVFV